MFVINCYEEIEKHYNFSKQEKDFAEMELMRIFKVMNIARRINEYCKKYDIYYYIIGMDVYEFLDRNDELRVRLACL